MCARVCVCVCERVPWCDALRRIEQVLGHRGAAPRSPDDLRCVQPAQCRPCCAAHRARLLVRDRAIQTSVIHPSIYPSIYPPTHPTHPPLLRAMRTVRKLRGSSSSSPSRPGTFSETWHRRVCSEMCASSRPARRIRCVRARSLPPSARVFPLTLRTLCCHAPAAHAGVWRAREGAFGQRLCRHARCR